MKYRQSLNSTRAEKFESCETGEREREREKCFDGRLERSVYEKCNSYLRRI